MVYDEETEQKGTQVYVLGKAGLKGDPNGRQASSQGLPSLHNKGSGRGVIEENLKKRRGEVSPCEPT